MEFSSDFVETARANRISLNSTNLEAFAASLQRKLLNRSFVKYTITINGIGYEPSTVRLVRPIRVLRTEDLRYVHIEYEIMDSNSQNRSEAFTFPVGVNVNHDKTLYSFLSMGDSVIFWWLDKERKLERILFPPNRS